MQLDNTKAEQNEINLLDKSIDVLDKKADSVLEAYKKYYKENTGFFSTDPVLEIKQFGGWRSIAAVQVYLHTNTMALSRCVEALES